MRGSGISPPGSSTKCDVMDNVQKKRLTSHIRQLLKERNALLVAHYYTEGDLQELAEETGGCVADSLEMADDARRHILVGMDEFARATGRFR